MKKKYLLYAVICLFIGLCAAVFAFAGSALFGNSVVEPAPISTVSPPKESEQTTPIQTELPATTPPSETPSETPYVSPIDFQQLWERNTDIFGWLDIPGTEITYPLLQSAEDDSFYLDHDADGVPSANGALFTERLYNSKDMSDPLTVIYGHHMKSGAMFGNLQEIYSDPTNFAECNEIVIYLPDQELHYTVFAAIPYDNRHLLQSFTLSNERSFYWFMDSIQSVRAISAQYDSQAEASFGDNILVLSTCLIGNSNNRYLVVAKLETVISSLQEN